MKTETTPESYYTNPLRVAVLLLATVCAVVVSFWKLEVKYAWIVTGVTIVIGIIIFFIASDVNKSEKSLDSPYSLSGNDAGKIFLVSKIRNDKIGLIPYGKKNNGYEPLTTLCTYYKTEVIPVGLRNVDKFFKVELTSNGLIFYEIIRDKYGDNHVVSNMYKLT